MPSTVPPTADFDVVASTQGAVLQDEHILSTATIKKRSLAGVLAYMTRTLTITGIAIAAQFILGAKLSAQEYGIYGIVVTITSFFTIISDVGLGASLIQKKEKPTVLDLRTVFTVQQLLAWLVVGLISATALILFHFGRLSQDGVYLALAFGISFPIVSIKTISSILLERDLAFNKLIIPAIVETLLFNCVAVILAMNGYGVMSFTYAVLVKSISGVVIMLLLQRWQFGFAFSKSAFLTLMKVGGGFQLNDMLAKAKDDLFYMSVAFIIPPTQFGYITWAKQWSRMPYSLTVDNISAITFPAYSRLQHDVKLLSRAIEKTIFFVTLLAFPMLAGLAVMIGPFTRVYAEYGKWQPALLTLGLFSFSFAFSTFSSPLISALQAIGHVKESLKMMVFWTVLQWVLFPILFPFFGYLTIAIIAAILGITSLLVVRLVQRQITFNFIEQVWRQTVATVAMILVLWLGQSVWDQSLVYIVVGILLGATVFGGLMVLLGFEKMKRETVSLLVRS